MLDDTIVGDRVSSTLPEMPTAGPTPGWPSERRAESHSRSCPSRAPASPSPIERIGLWMESTPEDSCRRPPSGERSPSPCRDWPRSRPSPRAQLAPTACPPQKRVKTNRVVRLKKELWLNLGTFSKNVKLKEFDNYMIDDHTYEIASYEAKLRSIPKVKLLVSREYNEKQRKWNDNFHLINTNKKNTVIQTIRAYALR